MSVTLGSLLGDDLRELGELGLLPPETQDLEFGRSGSHELISKPEVRETLGLPWFEDLIEGSHLGRIGRTRRGGGISADGRTRVEWEVVEFGSDENNGGNGGVSTAKRKIGDIGGGEGTDVKMGEGGS